MFAEEDMNDQVRNIQNDWDRPHAGYAIGSMPQPPVTSATPDARFSEFNARSGMQDAPVEDLRDYLVKKIREVQVRSDPHVLDRQIDATEKDFPKGDGQPPNAPSRFQFKASTLTHIAELRPLGQEKIENQFIDRLYREQTNYHYEKYIYDCKKDQAFEATALAKQRTMGNRKSMMSTEENRYMSLRTAGASDLQSDTS